VPLPIKTVAEDIEKVCGFLAKKPTGASVKEAKAVLDPKHLDGRKVAAFKAWGLVEEVGDKLKLTVAGRAYARGPKEEQQKLLRQIIRSCAPYNAMVERAAHRGEESTSATDVGAHWHEHFASDAGDSDTTLNDQANCFFQLAQGAGLGSFVIGRSGHPTRLQWDTQALRRWDSEDGTGLALEQPPATNGDEESATNGDEKEKGAPPPQGATAPTSKLGQSIFLAHGKKKQALEQLEKILRQFNIPFKVATDEPNLGRPISGKVRETMHQCNCAILIFTADEKFYRKNQQGQEEEVWRPSENVVHELGACGYLYENRIVIIKEDTVNFPSNFRDLGYISFSSDAGLEAKAMDILKELIGFGIVKVST
jgi:predicted nucleotide-binding protein